MIFLRLDLTCSTSIPSFEQTKHPSCWKIFKSRHNDIALMPMYMYMYNRHILLIYKKFHFYELLPFVRGRQCTFFLPGFLTTIISPIFREWNLHIWRPHHLWVRPGQRRWLWLVMGQWAYTNTLHRTVGGQDIWHKCRWVVYSLSVNVHVCLQLHSTPDPQWTRHMALVQASGVYMYIVV